jgi:predicted nucleic acid-binding protein
MRIYLDLCCFNRLYDDQSQIRIRIETEAKLALQQKIKEAKCELIWSSILDFECANNPFEEHRIAIMNWRELACALIPIDETVLAQAQYLKTSGVGHYDALHVACAAAAKADVFVTTDDRLLKRLKIAGGVVAMLPQDAIAFVENWYEN